MWGKLLLCVVGLVPLDAAARGVVLADRATGESVACRPAATCCKVCDKGKACGNTCISRRFDCHVGRGCACNASEICSGDEGER